MDPNSRDTQPDQIKMDPNSRGPRPDPTPAKKPTPGLGLKPGVQIADDSIAKAPRGSLYQRDDEVTKRWGKGRGRGRGDQSNGVGRGVGQSSPDTFPPREQPRSNPSMPVRSSNDQSNHGRASTIPRVPSSGQNGQQSRGAKGGKGDAPNRKRPINNGAAQRNANTIGMRAQWITWPSICLRLKGLPATTTTYDLWSLFERFGSLVSIELFDRNGVRDGGGRLRFTPPPKSRFWNDVMNLTIQGQQVKVTAELQQYQAEPIVQAPNGRMNQPSLSLTMKELQFGMLARENATMALKTVENNTTGEYTLTADFKQNCIEIVFACDMKDPRREDPGISHPSPVGRFECIQQYKANISFAHLKKLVFVDIDEDNWALVIPLSSPPVFYKETDRAVSHSTHRNTWNARDVWNRTVDITYDTAWLKDDPVTLRKASQFIDIGRWTIYRLVFSKSALADWDKIKLGLCDFNINVDDTTLKEFPQISARPLKMWDILEPQLINSSGPSDNLALLTNTEDVYLPYVVRYQLEVCISQGVLNEFDITSEFLHKLADLSNGRTNRRDRANDLLTYIAEPPSGWRIEDQEKLDPKRIYDPMSIFEDKKATSHYPEVSIPEHCQWIRKVVVTPTTMYLSSPLAEPSNRVLRQFAHYGDRFLRVQFTDEKTKGRIFPAPGSDQENALFNRVHRTLLNGIQIGGLHFQYLATGNSQFRENSAYFFAPTEHLTCDNIRNWMGDVNHIRVVAKHASRLGQCFSTTKAPKTSPIGQNIVHIKDIEHNDWCFTDGVGKIAPERAKFLAKSLDNTHKDYSFVPSVFQFRLGGSKGILVQWPDVPFNELHLRPSQNKFVSLSKGLEVIQASRYSVATLNRQTILILSCLGVPNFVFENMLKKQVRDYNNAMQDPQVATRLLSKFLDQNGVTTAIAQAIADGFMETKEPFVMAILQVWYAWSMRLLRDKARIVVEQSAFVFGCVDETRTLRGYYESPEPAEKKKDRNSLPQIFLQVPKMGMKPGQRAEYSVITGICVVGRNPSLHPGDIRVVEAVDVPGLRHLRDVVVFPAVGDRDIPSMCSGGDLDGDDFFVIWDSRLIPPEWNFPPMVHEAPESKALDRDVRVTDLISFFVRYMKNDSLSTIAHAHVAKCDSLLNGPKDEQCIELAHLHSNAVDYPKTGQEAHLKPSLRPKKFPHFMEKPPNKTYKSKKILGRLYDLVAKMSFNPNLDGPFDERILRRYKLDGKTLEAMRLVKRQHDKAMKQIMNQHEIETEFEVWSTFVLTRPRVGTDYKRQEKMEPVITNHKERFRSACMKVAGSTETDMLYRVVAAAYYVTWEEVQVVQAQAKMGKIAQGSLPRERMPFISFPWIFDHELGRIARSEAEYELEEMPKPVMASNAEKENDDAKFERLEKSAVVIEKGGEIYDEDHPPKEKALETDMATTQPTEVELMTDEEIVEVEEEEETGLDALARLGE
ncbi:RdRP-domain-containing protein [Hypoxylon sp. FL1284]|nr:RdRP-domain-containing protein [Hypoxylon sp. FL1284]